MGQDHEVQDLEVPGPVQDPVALEVLLGLAAHVEGLALAHVCVVHAQEGRVQGLALDLEDLDLLGYNNRLTLIIQWTPV